MSGLWLFVLFVPFIASLLGESRTAWVVCLLCSIMAVLLSVEPDRALLAWGTGMLISGVSLWERFRKIGMVGP